MNEKFSLDGKAAIVTGAAGGIGSAIVAAFRQAGAKVAGVDLDRARVQADLGISCDVSSESQTRDAVDRAAKAFGGLHILVNTAAVRDPTATVTEIDLTAWNRIFAVNVAGAYLMSRWVVPHIERSGGGSIIHIASQLGTVGTPGRVAYCATKGAPSPRPRPWQRIHGAKKTRSNTFPRGGSKPKPSPCVSARWGRGGGGPGPSPC